MADNWINASKPNAAGTFHAPKGMGHTSQCGREEEGASDHCEGANFDYLKAMIG